MIVASMGIFSCRGLLLLVVLVHDPQKVSCTIILHTALSRLALFDALPLVAFWIILSRIVRARATGHCFIFGTFRRILLTQSHGINHCLLHLGLLALWNARATIHVLPSFIFD